MPVSHVVVALEHPAPAQCPKEPLGAGVIGPEFREVGAGIERSLLERRQQAVGMAPMGAGLGGHGGPGGETGTQLFEDDKQIFGPGNQDLPGGVLE